MSSENENPEIIKRMIGPYINGFSLRIFIFLLDYVPGLASYLFWDRISALRKLNFDECPTNFPLPLPKEYFGIEETKKVEGLEIFEENESAQQNYSSGFLCSSDFRKAYLTKKATPLQVCEILIGKLEGSLNCNPSLNAIIKYEREDIIKQATASTTRYANNCSLGPLDGVPITIKDELDVEGYETNVGTSFINRGVIAKTDATVIERLREKGAIIIGKTSMHEIGFGITGNNPSVCTSRNPYNIDHYTGGSSSGSASAVASGLCPIAIGCDGGGSIRIPSAFCGIYGLKTTFGRFSSKGELPLAPTVAVSGPMTASANDLALAYYVMAGKDEEDPNTYYQPKPTLSGLYNTKDLSDLKIGIYTAWNKQVCNPTITLALNNFIEKLKLLGANFVEIDIPELEEASIAHLLTIGSEISTFANKYKENFHKYNCQSRLNMSLFHFATASDYIISQQLRTRLMRSLSNLFNKQVNLILTPSTAITAPKIYPNSLKYGEADLKTVSEVMMYVTFVNFSGIPAVSVPAGYDDNNLPIGLQFVAKWFDEATLLRIAKVSEEILGDKRKRPSNDYWFGDLIQD
ncbi:Asp-tRNAAsn/Glu-tRNAGln amidotransferase A subunit and related amidase [Rhizophagus diaphanus]|nr:Asp-tRNAAsn/Glu-tRNAGln amidotransferase A subunit and related amidase [Rhizophagus diaphanus] [Rhizophagus sp. MUCL 43196]